MELTASRFECFPAGTPAHQHLGGLIAHIGEVRYNASIGTRNSNQFTYSFDAPLESRLTDLGCTQCTVNLCDGLRNQSDFAFMYSGVRVAVEVEKANWEKILYDFLKFHIYFASGAQFAMLFLPRNYPHSGGEVDSFTIGCERYQQCLKYHFGDPEHLGRILLVGFEQFTADGTRLSSSVRRQMISRWRAASTTPSPNLRE
jgi:hypothetical protein